MRKILTTSSSVFQIYCVELPSGHFEALIFVTFLESIFKEDNIKSPVTIWLQQLETQIITI